MQPDAILSQASKEMEKAVSHLLHEFASIHTGKATPAMVENVVITVYGSSMQLKEVAAITTPDARTISIQPWDKSVLKEVEKSLLAQNLGFTPTIMGDKVFCPLPDLSRDRRLDLVKVCHGYGEQAKVSVRAARRDAMDALKKLEKDKLLSEDDRKRFEKKVQDETDGHVGKIDKCFKDKEADLLKV